MKRTLNDTALKGAMARRGLSQASLAERLGVTPSAVSNWTTGKDFPRPDKLLRLGMLLGLEFERLVVECEEPSDPVPAFRRKGSRKLSVEHDAAAVHMGRLLEKLAPLLPVDNLERPRALREPSTDYPYLQRVARAVREQMNVAPNAPVTRTDLIARYADLQATLIPVLWGPRDHHQNALHVYLPSSMSTWVYLNLDSKCHDFNFWMAHELGHVYAPDLRDEIGEVFADRFAQALLFPEDCATATYRDLSSCRGKGQRINRIKETAEKFGISPTTVNYALQSYAQHHGHSSVDVAKDIFPATTQYAKQMPTVSEELFAESPPSPRQYVELTAAVFQSHFFTALKAYLGKADNSIGYVSTLLQIPLLDARSLVEALR